ncbi:MAG: NAD-dependent protein deacetylase [Pseudomonadota bacterium]
MSADALGAYLSRADRLFVVTGAGISAPSGIDTYRDDKGSWQKSQPIQHQDFVSKLRSRQRYWARSMRGWPMFRDARPNAAHEALAELEAAGRIQRVITQNVDGLHQRAGQRRVVELHGSLESVRCLNCGHQQSRDAVQQWLEAENPDWLDARVEARPDGDADFLGVRQFDDFRTPPCEVCGGVLKPDVVFYGDSVPRERVSGVRQDLADADAVLVVGSSLMVYSSFRFMKEAHALGLPMVALNRGATRADDWFAFKWQEDCAVALPRALAHAGLH